MPKKVFDHIIARLKYYDFEGGFWGIDDDNGNQWLPINLSEEWFSKKEVDVLVSFRVDKNLISLVQWGTPIEITKIQKR